MTEIDFAYFNFEHVLSAYLQCLFRALTACRASRFPVTLCRVAATFAVHADDFVLVPRLGVVGCRVPADYPGGDAGAGR